MFDGISPVARAWLLIIAMIIAFGGAAAAAAAAGGATLGWCVITGLSAGFGQIVTALMKSPAQARDEQNSTPPPPGRLGVWILFVLLAIGLTGCFSGCANADRNIYRVEVGAGATASAAHKGYAVYWKAATNNPAAYNTTLPALLSQRASVDANTILVGASLEQVDNLRLAVRTNDTVGPALNAALLTLANNASNITAIVTNIITIKPTK